MDPQVDEIARLIKESEDRVKKHVDELETRVKMQLETVEDKVKRAAEGYGGTLESIDRRLDRLEKSWIRNFKMHSAVLKNHAGRIEALEKLD